MAHVLAWAQALRNMRKQLSLRARICEKDGEKTMKPTCEWIYEMKVILTDGDCFLLYDTLPRCIEKLNSFYGTVSRATFKIAQR